MKKKVEDDISKNLGGFSIGIPITQNLKKFSMRLLHCRIAMKERTHDSI